MLTADMSAFKAANPGATLGDFVRWHSPRDWLHHPPPGCLSPRMAHPVRPPEAPLTSPLLSASFLSRCLCFNSLHRPMWTSAFIHV